MQETRVVKPKRRAVRSSRPKVAASKTGKPYEVSEEALWLALCDGVELEKGLKKTIHPVFAPSKRKRPLKFR